MAGGLSDSTGPTGGCVGTTVGAGAIGAGTIGAIDAGAMSAGPIFGSVDGDNKGVIA
jgi:hypothetical protein